MSIQFIEHKGKKQYAILPINIYTDLLEKVELQEDTAAYQKSKLDNDELVPSDIVYRLVGGENKIKVWREYRGMTQSELAVQSRLAQPTIAQMEGGKRTGSVAVLKKIALALKLDLDDLC